MKTLKTYCYRCAGVTNHEIMFEHSQRFDQSNTPEMHIDYADGTWQTVRCLGCETVSFREYWHTSEDWDEELGPTGTEHRYPDVGPDDLQEVESPEMPHKLKRLYHEIIKSYNSGLVTGCATLIRAMIEGIANNAAKCLDIPEIIDLTKKPKGKGLIEWKIEQLVSNGLLSSNEGNILQESRFLGNKAIHELKIPSKKELKELIRILEHALVSVFGVTEKLAELQFRRAKSKRS